MNRRGVVITAVASAAVVGSVGTAYVGTGWVHEIASTAGASLRVIPSFASRLGLPSLPYIGNVQGVAFDTQRIAPAPSPTVTKAAPSPRAILATVVPLRESAIIAGDLQIELNRLPVAGVLTTDERNDLQWMRAEENLARDVYLALFLKWRKWPFAAIAAAEATHGEAVRQLLVRYDIADPAPGPEGTSATDPTFGAMYRELVTAGSRSFVDALRIAANIEELDIHDLRDRRSTRADIATVFHGLEAGSKENLRAFVQEIERQGFAWVPSYLKTAEFAQIMGRSTAYTAQ
jgi:hypothetical protein